MEKLLTVKEVAQVLNCHPQTLYKNKEFPRIVLPGIGVRFREKDIKGWINKRSLKNHSLLESFTKVDLALDKYDKLFLERRTELKGLVTWSYPFGSVRMRKTKNKEERYYIDYQVDGHRIRKALKGVKTRAEAVKVLNADVSDAQRCKYYFHKKKISFCEMADLFLEKYSKIKKRSWKSADRVFIRSMKPFFGDLQLSKITPMIIEDYKIDRLKNGKGRRKDEKIKNRSVNAELSCLRKMFNKAIDWGYVSENPVKKVDFLSEKGSIRKRILGEDEEMRFLAAAPFHLKHMIIVALHTGMRKSEVLKLKWDNVDFDKREITIVETKDDEDRIVPMNPFLFNLLLTLKSRDGKSEHVFTNPRTGTHYVEIKRAFTSAREKAGIADFHFHDLRHTHASRLVRNGADLNTVKELLGHSSITTTQRYLHSQADQKRAAVNSLAGQKYEFSPQCQNSDKQAINRVDVDSVTPSYLSS